MSIYKKVILNDNILENIPKRLENSNKGTYGKVLIIAGSYGMAGASFLSALAAYRSGAGIVKILCPYSNRIILQNLIPEALISCYNENIIEKDKKSFYELIKRELSFATTIVIGPGLGLKPYVRYLVEYTLSLSQVPTIVDADAINIIAEYNYLEQYFKDSIILTPHLKEMERLSKTSLDIIKFDSLSFAIKYCENKDVSLVLKSDQTIIISKNKIYINNIKAAALAKAGSGDVLSGIIAGMLSLGIEKSLALALGVYLHNLSARLASQEYSEHGIIARDVISYIPIAMKYNKKEL